MFLHHSSYYTSIYRWHFVGLKQFTHRWWSRILIGKSMYLCRSKWDNLHFAYIFFSLNKKNLYRTNFLLTPSIRDSVPKRWFLQKYVKINKELTAIFFVLFGRGSNGWNINCVERIVLVKRTVCSHCRHKFNKSFVFLIYKVT